MPFIRTFLRGAGSSFDILPATRPSLKRARSGLLRSGGEALRQDLERIGRDLWQPVAHEQARQGKGCPGR